MSSDMPVLEPTPYELETDRKRDARMSRWLFRLALVLGVLYLIFTVWAVASGRDQADAGVTLNRQTVIQQSERLAQIDCNIERLLYTHASPIAHIGGPVDGCGLPLIPGPSLAP